MKKVLSIVCILLVLIQLVSCRSEPSKKDLTQQTNITQDKVDIDSTQDDSPLEQEIKTKEYSISVPKDWSYEESGTLNFKKQGYEIGGVYIQPYYSDVSNPVSSLLPNHSEIVESKELDGFFTEAEKIVIVTSPSAASKDTNTEKWEYIFLIEDKTTIYEMFFNMKYIDEDDILKIAKSFKIL